MKPFQFISQLFNFSINSSIVQCLLAVLIVTYINSVNGDGAWIPADGEVACSQVCGQRNMNATIVGRYHGNTAYYLCASLSRGISGIRQGVNLEPEGSTSPVPDYVERVSKSCFIADGTYEKHYKCLCEY